MEASTMENKNTLVKIVTGNLF